MNCSCAPRRSTCRQRAAATTGSSDSVVGAGATTIMKPFSGRLRYSIICENAGPPWLPLSSEKVCATSKPCSSQ